MGFSESVRQDLVKEIVLKVGFPPGLVLCTKKKRKSKGKIVDLGAGMSLDCNSKVNGADYSV